jgi:hypothetical protein
VCFVRGGRLLRRPGADGQRIVAGRIRELVRRLRRLHELVLLRGGRLVGLELVDRRLARV